MRMAVPKRRLLVAADDGSRERAARQIAMFAEGGVYDRERDHDPAKHDAQGPCFACMVAGRLAALRRHAGGAR